MGKLLEPSQNIERSVMKKYRKELWNPFIKAVKNYELVQENDKIAVCISGGKDSMLMAKLMQLLQRYGDVPFELTFLVMDPGYNEKNRKKIEENAKILNVPITVFETNIFDVANSVDKSPCYLCARMRRGYLYSRAKELGCNKIAYAHHRDDLIETALMSLIYEGRFHAFSPYTHLDRTGLTVIRPMLYVSEADVKGFRNRYQLPVCKNPCPMDGHTRREYVKNLIRTLDRENPGVKDRLFSAVMNGHLEGWPDICP